MQTAQDWKRNQGWSPGCSDGQFRRWFRPPLPNALIGSCLIEVQQVLREYTPQLPFIEEQNVIQTFESQRANEVRTASVEIGRLRLTFSPDNRVGQKTSSR